MTPRRGSFITIVAALVTALVAPAIVVGQSLSPVPSALACRPWRLGHRRPSRCDYVARPRSSRMASACAWSSNATRCRPENPR